jgi:hypothetical protein
MPNEELRRGRGSRDGMAAAMAWIGARFGLLARFLRLPPFFAAGKAKCPGLPGT